MDQNYFLFWLFLFGILVATFQDLKRREVDNWLNLFLFFSSFSYVVFLSIQKRDPLIIFNFYVVFVLCLFFMGLFYFGRIFAGGDAKLLLCMSAAFLGSSFYEGFFNVLLFLFFLMVFGSIYGIFYSVFLYLRNFKKVNENIKLEFNFINLSFLLLGFLFLVFSFFNLLFLVMSLVLLVFPLIYSFARALERGAMIREVKGSQLREGDWLDQDISYKGRKIRASFEGLSKEEVLFLKNIKKVRIREGIPFVPAFLFSYIFYFIFRASVFSFFGV